MTSPAAFRAQMKHLYRMGWRGIPLNEWDGREKTFVLAFDDGYQCVGDFVPDILTEFGFRATIFMPTGFLGRKNDWDHQVYGLKFSHLNANGLVELAEAGWEIGSHTVSHRSLTDLSMDRIARELFESKKILAEICGQPITSLSFPFGRYNRHVLDTAILAGYIRGIVPAYIGNSVSSASLSLFEADAVYMWDRFLRLEGRLERSGTLYRTGRLFRRIVNRVSLGTVIYQRLSSGRS